MGSSPAQLVYPHNGIYFEPEALEPPQRDDESVAWRIVKRELRKPSGPDYFNRKMIGAQIPALIGTVIESSPPGRPETLIISLPADNIHEATLKLDHLLKHDVPTGQIIMFEGVATDFTQTPLMLAFKVQTKKTFFLRGKHPTWKRAQLRPYEWNCSLIGLSRSAIRISCRETPVCSTVERAPVIFIGELIDGGITSLTDDPWYSKANHARFSVIEAFRGLPPGTTTVDVQLHLWPGMCAPIPYYRGERYLVTPAQRDGVYFDGTCFSGEDVEKAIDRFNTFETTSPAKFRRTLMVL